MINTARAARIFGIIVFLLAFLMLRFGRDAQAEPWTLQVVGENGQPILAKVRVLRDWGEEPQVLETNAAGKLAANTELYMDNYLGRVFIFAPGHAPAGGVLRPGANRAKLGAPHSLKGRVIGDDGKPLSNVTVGLTNFMREVAVGEKITLENAVDFVLMEYEKPLFATRSDADGNYEIRNLPARGTAIIAISDPLWQNNSVRVDLQNSAQAPELQTRPAARLSGRLLDENGQPVAGKTVFASDEKHYALAETDAAGRYLLGGIPSGKTSVSVAENPMRDSGVAEPIEVVAVIGEETRVPNIHLMPGALLELELTPTVSDGFFDMRRDDLSNSQAGFFLRPKDGKILLRVRPGTYRLKINTPPKGWIAPTDWPEDGLKIEARAHAGSTPSRKIAIRLVPSLTLSGLAQDETGAPVAGAFFSQFTNSPFNENDETNAVSDANGRFVLRNLKPGEITLSSGAQWDIVSPKKVTVPAAKPVVVTLRKVNLVPLSGRVVDERGKPIENALVTVEWLVPQDDTGGFSNQRRDRRTDAEGRYAVDKVRADGQVTIKAAKPHYRFKSGGELSIQRTILAIDGGQMPNPNAVFSVSDLVMVSLERKVSGQVVDKSGAPVANALVGALGGGQEEISAAPRNIARTDAAGRFQLSDLPDGELDFVAGAENGLVQIRSAANALPDMVLQPQDKPESDFELAQKIVIELIAVTGDDYYARRALPYTLAYYDYSAALEAVNATHPDKPNQPEEMRNLVSVWLDSSPQSALAALPAMLPNLERNAGDAWFGAFVTQVALALTQPKQKALTGETPDAAALRAWVRKQFERLQIKAEAADLSNYNDLEMAYSLSALAVLSETLGEESADQWAKTAIEIAARYDAIQKNENNRSGGVASTAEGMAFGGVRLALAALLFVPPADRAYALGRMIPEIAKNDLAGARRLLELLPHQIKPENTNVSNADPEWAFGLAAKAILRRMSTPDASEALTLARRVTAEFHRGEALALAARLQPEAAAAPLFREAFSFESSRQAERETALIVNIALQAHPKIGNELLAKIENDFFDSGQGLWNQSPAMTTTAFYMAQTQPGRARAWLEWQWARAQNTVGSINGAIELEGIAMAMSAVSTARALEMADAIPPRQKPDKRDDLTWRWETKRKIAQYLAAPESARRTINFSRWGAGDTWTPGTDTGW